jgi:hypothetical protein
MVLRSICLTLLLLAHATLSCNARQIPARQAPARRSGSGSGSSNKKVPPEGYYNPTSNGGSMLTVSSSLHHTVRSVPLTDICHSAMCAPCYPGCPSHLSHGPGRADKRYHIGQLGRPRARAERGPGGPAELLPVRLSVCLPCVLKQEWSGVIRQADCRFVIYI